MWDSNSPPPSSDKEWSKLNTQEQAAALALGFTQSLWDNFEDQ